MRHIVAISALLCSQPTMAAELSLNDIPEVLNKIRGCEIQKGIISNTTICKIPANDLWVSVNPQGELTLFKRNLNRDTTYAGGKNVKELLRDFATKLNQNSNENKIMVDAMAPYLDTQ